MTMTLKISTFFYLSEHERGKTMEEVLAAKPTQEYDSDWGGGFINPEQFVRILYKDLSED